MYCTFTVSMHVLVHVHVFCNEEKGEAGCNNTCTSVVYDIRTWYSRCVIRLCSR